MDEPGTELFNVGMGTDDRRFTAYDLTNPTMPRLGGHYTILQGRRQEASKSRTLAGTQRVKRLSVPEDAGVMTYGSDVGGTAWRETASSRSRDV